MNKRVRYEVNQYSKARVEVIPMIDIMMFLLVFFVIVTLKMIDGSGVPMEIPGSKTIDNIETSTLTIGVDKNGTVFVDGKNVSETELAEKLNELKKTNKLAIIIAGDKETSLQYLIGVMDTVRGAGINTVSIAARAEQND